ncbi:MAG: 50S ribosomal protein L25 [Ilumatobacter sp.]|uniref:50S ribosomal protein L25 n=1 Tax=uncultured Ilumatobacter sp. TaxID=879968 RepID=UPI003590779A|tara:strand:+ start:1191 stop:1838 length:648 start_codon:yes stop_codon:yes gene_type:complete
MSETVLIAEAGRTTGSSESRRLRTADRIPGVVYGHGMDPLSVSVARRDLRVALSGESGMNTILDLSVNGEVYPSLVKAIQRHPVKRNVQHIDFIQVDLNEEVTVNVPVRLVGEAKAVEADGGLVDVTMNVIEVTTTPRNIPSAVVIDVSEMDMETTIRVSDVVLPAGVTATADPEYPVVTVLTMRTPVLDAEAEAIEAAAAEAAEGDAPAGDTAE